MWVCGAAKVMKIHIYNCLHIFLDIGFYGFCLAQFKWHIINVYKTNMSNLFPKNNIIHFISIVSLHLCIDIEVFLENPYLHKRHRVSAFCTGGLPQKCKPFLVAIMISIFYVQRKRVLYFKREVFLKTLSY